MDRYGIGVPIAEQHGDAFIAAVAVFDPVSGRVVEGTEAAAVGAEAERCV
jgi:hypothetical protein